MSGLGRRKAPHLLQSERRVFDVDVGDVADVPQIKACGQASAQGSTNMSKLTCFRADVRRALAKRTLALSDLDVLAIIASSSRSKKAEQLDNQDHVVDRR